ncbi:cytochrome bc complex cytochrome b subunit [Pseudoclavibacter chungangensis]|uniref:Cytochrome bc1 complex cytochrome b subunit n=1 Tax=Pseudoclavibacter chungangensis TaxID=587635 RepID=A0A7J5BZS5_9MICO|nr:cytochrome bc complex cytochrome b subunit [Pseudoclavibacter chungangensis]KAB1660128.1 cytochrome bc complex cytochrome b subunit [Pseudoclavibacter chungangensis]NYJ66765.1 ubiquinol-cytochrome c reductase cytochrome b subunit [Pseudoclavibacter chungangensis]
MTTTSEAPVRPDGFIGKAANYLDERTSISGAVKEFGRKIFPDHWSFMLGEVALYSFVAILLSGTFLTFFFDPSMAHTVYEGSYLPLKGIGMSVAMQSTLDISFDVRGGLLMRQVHHWAALLFVASIGLHMLRVFFTGAFRKPRELNWIVGFVLFVLAMAEGFTGYSLPDDLLSGNGLRIIDGMVKSFPLIGAWISFLLFGGEFPGIDIVGRLYALHIMILPAMVILFIALHLALMVINKHTQWPGPGHTNENVVGSPVLPGFASKAGGFFFLIFGFIFLIASFFSINPIWNYGPYDPSPVSAGTQPDWYIGFADGALRLAPPRWETYWFNHTWAWGVLVPVIVLGLFIVTVAVYPFIEAWVTGDKREHHLLDRPRNAPVRTAIGAAGVTFYAVMWAAASSDLISTHFHLAMEHVIHFLQASLFLGPVIAFVITKRICLGLQKKDRSLALHGIETGRVIRLPSGEFLEVHTPVSEEERWVLTSYNDNAPIVLRPNAEGKITPMMRVRAALSRWFFEDRIEPVTKAELESAEHH